MIPSSPQTILLKEILEEFDEILITGTAFSRQWRSGDYEIAERVVRFDG